MNTPCVYIVGAGPGDPSLVSVRGQRCLQAADVVVFDHRVHRRLLRLAQPGAERIDVGAAAPKALDQDAICYLLAEKAREGKTVVRLKWGDPFVFDSGGKEALFLHEQRIPFEVVPGIPAAIGCLAYAGVPVTYPGAGDTLTFIRGHESEVDAPPDVDWSRLAGLTGTLVCFAGSRQIGAITEALLSTRTAGGRNGCPDLQRHASRTGDDLGNACRHRVQGPRWSCGVACCRCRRRTTTALALVRRAPALRPPYRRDAIARAGGRAHRDARGTRRRGHPGAEHPDRAS